MGLSVSKAASEAAVSESVKNVLVSCTSSEVYPLGDALWNDVFATKQALNLADPGAMHLATRSYCSRMST